MNPALTLIKENRLKQSAVAAAIGISNSAFTNKATGREKFTKAQLAGIDAYLLNLYKSLGSYLNLNESLEPSLNLNENLEAVSPQASFVVDEPPATPINATPQPTPKEEIVLNKYEKRVLEKGLCTYEQLLTQRIKVAAKFHTKKTE